MREELTAYMTTSGVDPSGLGRWSWYLLEGEEGYQTRVVTAHTPCGSTAIETETYYQQQARYIVENTQNKPKGDVSRRSPDPTEEMENKRGHNDSHDVHKRGRD